MSLERLKYENEQIIEILTKKNEENKMKIRIAKSYLKEIERKEKRIETERIIEKIEKDIETEIEKLLKILKNKRG